MGKDRLEVLKSMMIDVYVNVTLFEIPLGHTRVQSHRLKEFMLEFASPYVYDRFIETWAMFPHHETPSLFFQMHIC